MLASDTSSGIFKAVYVQVSRERAKDYSQSI